MRHTWRWHDAWLGRRTAVEHPGARVKAWNTLNTSSQVKPPQQRRGGSSRPSPLWGRGAPPAGARLGNRNTRVALHRMPFTNNFDKDSSSLMPRPELSPMEHRYPSLSMFLLPPPPSALFPLHSWSPPDRLHGPTGMGLPDHLPRPSDHTHAASRTAVLAAWPCPVPCCYVCLPTALLPAGPSDRAAIPPNDTHSALQPPQSTHPHRSL